MAGGAQQSGKDSLWIWRAHFTAAMTGQGRRMDGSQGWNMDAPERPAQMLPIGNGVANGIYARASAWGAWPIRPRRWRCVCRRRRLVLERRFIIVAALDRTG